MTRSTDAKYVNEHYFDQGSKAMYYVLSTFYACYNPQKDSGFVFRSSSKDLVQIVKDESDMEHEIQSDPRGKSSHWIQANNVPHLHERLADLGLNVPKYERAFPTVPEEYINHFVRGFFDARARFRYENGSLVAIITFGNRFLAALNQTLAEYAGVEHEDPKIGLIVYKMTDLMKIRDFIYRDWDFVQESGLYLPEKKECLDLLTKEKLLAKNYVDPKTIEMRRKIEKAIELIKQGMMPIEAGEAVGYKSANGFYIAFRAAEGIGVREFIKKRMRLVS